MSITPTTFFPAGSNQQHQQDTDDFSDLNEGGASCDTWLPRHYPVHHSHVV